MVSCTIYKTVSRTMKDKHGERNKRGIKKTDLKALLSACSCVLDRDSEY